MASDWLAAVLPANQMPGLKIFILITAASQSDARFENLS